MGTNGRGTSEKDEWRPRVSACEELLRDATDLVILMSKFVGNLRGCADVYASPFVIATCKELWIPGLSVGCRALKSSFSQPALDNSLYWIEFALGRQTHEVHVWDFGKLDRQEFLETLPPTNQSLRERGHA